ncbi:putative autotransporter adhesin-like protein [Novosphingobium sp. PhB165]|uniref:GIN domain-containing protein n=1 Tax=Novosphingobium sp. PhB165 TaxID=2485105 RepID=UPI001049D650|nr:DUF2807 domain-containing protein [Novosphingobium sp. PhB165]TCM18633.1 putative autotransporter adhesin-like protein [Novosphingobium sp. PhB165]
MFRKLLIVFASGVILSIVAFGAAWVVGGDKFRQEFRDNGGWSFEFGDDEKDHGPEKTRTFALQPGTRLAMDIPVQLVFTKGDKSEMIVTGPQKVVDRLTWNDGRLSIDGSLHMHKGLKVRITAPEIAAFDFDAPGDVTLTGLDQDSLTLKAQGAINLDASGKVRKLDVQTEGASNLDLGKLEAQDATVSVDGVGSVTIGATGNVSVAIDGIGSVRLVRKPAHLTTDINGLGKVDHDYQ